MWAWAWVDTEGGQRRRRCGIAACPHSVKHSLCARGGMAGGGDDGEDEGTGGGGSGPIPPALQRSLIRSGAGRPRGRPAVDGPCGCGWGDALMPGSRLGRLLSGLRGNRAVCGCSTAITSRASFDFTADPKATVSVLIRPNIMPSRTRLILEAVEPRGPWRLFIGAPPAKQAMFGPYGRADTVVSLLSETVSLLRGTGMTVSIEGDFDRVMGTFRGNDDGLHLPTASELTGG